MRRNNPVIAAALRPENRPYQPFGFARDVILARDDELIVDGPAGTGKTIANLNKGYAILSKYEGARGLIIRKTRASLTDSALVTWESKVVPQDHPILIGAGRGNRRSYTFPNGSELVCGGMDKATKVLSTEYDFIYVPECTEISEAEWEILSTRLRWGKVPYQMIYGDCNPDRPTHWIKLRQRTGKLKLMPSRHEDNPYLFDQDLKQWTAPGRAYIDKLERLTGARLLRMRYGRWAASEGLVYQTWDHEVHMMDRRPIPRNWQRIWSIDFGYNNPFVWGCWVIDPDGALILIYQIYMTKRIVADHAEKIAQIMQEREEPFPLKIICDHDAEDRATLERELSRHLKREVQTLAAKKAIRPGIEAVEQRLRKRGNGRPRLFLMRDSLVELDDELSDAKQPTRTEDEFDSYVWPKPEDVKNPDKREVPVDQYNHGMDMIRYAVADQDLRSLENESSDLFS